MLQLALFVIDFSVFMFLCMQLQIYGESAAPDQATQWGDWVWSLENEEEEALGDGFVYLWLPNKRVCSSGLILFSMYHVFVHWKYLWSFVIGVVGLLDQVKFSVE